MKLKLVLLIFQATSSDGIFMTRHVALRSGIPIEKPALTINRLCGSGFQSIVNGAQVMILSILRDCGVFILLT